MKSELISALNSIGDPEDEIQLTLLDDTLSEIDAGKCGPDELRALFGVFERFPQADGFGVFWSILHKIEACNGCADALIASVKRAPGDFNLLMVNRLLNSGVTHVGEQSLVELLRKVADNPNTPPHARTRALHFIEYQSTRAT